ncbi:MULTISPECIES: hypothetical protein [unclassified Corallococcus]|uniref:hypothetical protein n=1 Tax=unclassified Corallococcus TaxID=2685029 RepID=UPI001A8C77C9|nr:MULTISPECIES: hypothetical protein [unclassified Corallococcus]MBN9683610.1 hypothetical protein [Corallococcus sp. NCSPR001]WAS84878.1 hypothetical protein O0N60_37155 [Corallococcus sp. NCRR]
MPMLTSSAKSRYRLAVLLTVFATNLATAEEPAPSSRASPDACPLALRVVVEPQELKKQVRGAKTVSGLRKLLHPLGLDSAWERQECMKEDGAASAQLDVFRARIVSADAQDIILQVRGQACDGLKLLDGVVLHPLGAKNTFCAVRMEFLPGVVESQAFRVVFSFENLTDPVRQVFRVEQHDADSRNEYETLSYWEAQEGALRSIFTIESGSHMGFVNGATEVKVTPVGDAFPRFLQVKESSRDCGGFVDMPSGESVYEDSCRDAENEVRMCYRRKSPGAPGVYDKC